MRSPMPCLLGENDMNRSAVDSFSVARVPGGKDQEILHRPFSFSFSSSVASVLVIARRYVTDPLTPTKRY